jgi:outer membrane protein OmpU
MNMKRVLLSSTAIVGAGMFLANPAHAQIEVTLSGYTEFGVVWGEEEELVQPAGDPSDNNFDFFMDNEVFVQAQGTDDATGITYGSTVELEVGSFGGATPQDVEAQGDAFVDEVLLFFSGAFGRTELGQEDGATDVMMLDAASVAAGTGGIDGDLPILLTTAQIVDTDDEAKVTYYTPRVGGFQAGVSYVPDVAGNEHFIEAGLNFVGQFAGLDVGVAGVASLVEGFDDLEDNTSWQAGGTVGFAGLNFGASYGRDNARDDFTLQGVDVGELELITAGVGFGLGPANASFTWEYNDYDEGPVDDAHLFVGSADVGLMPGVVLKGDVGYNTDALQLGGDEAWAAVASVPLTY